MIKVENLTKSFDSILAVDRLSFSVSEGEIYGLLGPNGAGKTTTISMICGLLEPDAGSVYIGNINFFQEPLKAKQLMGFVPQEIALYGGLTAKENLNFWGRLYGMSKKEIAERGEEALKKVGLWKRANDIVDKYSGGMKHRLNLAVALLHRPKVLLLDEPTVGIDPQGRINILEVVQEIAKEGTSVLYTTHYMDEAEQICHKIGIMDHGKLLAEGTLKELVGRLGEGRIVTISGKFGIDEITPFINKHSQLKPLSIEENRSLFLAPIDFDLTFFMKEVFSYK